MYLGRNNNPTFCTTIPLTRKCGRYTSTNLTTDMKKSGRRDSNPRPQPWQGCALPTELLPHIMRESLALLVQVAKESYEKSTPFSQLHGKGTNKIWNCKFFLSWLESFFKRWGRVAVTTSILSVWDCCIKANRCVAFGIWLRSHTEVCSLQISPSAPCVSSFLQSQDNLASKIMRLLTFTTVFL